MFLKYFNGTTKFEKPSISKCDTLFLDAWLTGLGEYGQIETIQPLNLLIPGFDLKIVHLEMLSIVVAMCLWCKYWVSLKVIIYNVTMRLVCRR